MDDTKKTTPKVGRQDKYPNLVKTPKGVPSTNPSGAPKIPFNLAKAKRIKTVECQEVLIKCLNSTYAELLDMANNRDGISSEVLLAALTVGAIAEKCPKKAEFLFSRIGWHIPKPDTNITFTQNVLQSMPTGDLVRLAQEAIQVLDVEESKDGTRSDP